MEYGPVPIEYEGRQFPTLKSFATEYGLNYARVRACHKAGRTPQEIVETCSYRIPDGRMAPRANSRAMSCEYNGVRYSSLYDAAKKLNLSANHLYEVRKRHQFTASEAIAFVMKSREKKEDRPVRSGKLTVVESREYPSQEEAARAYHVPAATVYARMEREHIPFEEALLRAHRMNRYRPPAVTLYPDLRLQPMPPSWELKQPALIALVRALEYYRCPVENYRDIVSGLPVLVAEKCTCVYYNVEASGLEMVSELPLQLDPGEIDLINSAYVTAKMIRIPRSGGVFLSTFHFVREDGKDPRSLTNAYFSHASLREHLLRKYSAGGNHI